MNIVSSLALLVIAIVCVDTAIIFYRQIDPGYLRRGITSLFIGLSWSSLYWGVYGCLKLYGFKYIDILKLMGGYITLIPLMTAVLYLNYHVSRSSK